MEKKLISISCAILLFCYIFSFPIYGPFDSSKLVGLLLIFKYMFDKKYQFFVNSFFSHKNVLVFYLISCVLALWIFLVQIIHSTFDYSFLVTYINFNISIFIGMILVSYFDLYDKKSELLNYIIIAFIIQTVIQWICYFSPSIYKVTSIFRTESMKKHYITYTGVRGLAISGSGFFGLSSSYGLIYILYFDKMNTLFKNDIKKFICYLFLITGTFFSGRTGYIGLFIGIMYFFICSFRFKISKKSAIYYIVVFICCIIGIVLLKEKMVHVYNYTFELFISIFKRGTFSISSMQSLQKMYSVKIKESTLLFGDGIYEVVENGITKYYMNTDVGYLRKLFYFGLPGIIVMCFQQITILSSKVKNNIFLFIILYILVLEFKGEVLSFLIIFQSILIVYSNSYECSKYECNDYIVKK